MHSRQAFVFALYRARTPNIGKYRGKGLAFVTGEIWGSQRYTLLIRRQCIGYVVFSTLYLTLYRSIVPYERRLGIHAINPYGTFTVGVVGIGQKNTP